MKKMLETEGNGEAVFALLLGSFVWGVIWFPYRALRDAGVDGVTASTLSYAVALLIGLLLFRKKLRTFRPSWPMFWLALTAGGCNLGFVLAMLSGEIMRVMLLFYLAPLWTVLLARWLLDERLNRFGVMLVALSVSGAMTMLWQPQLGLPLPQGLADFFALGAGICFAVFNVVSRHQGNLDGETKSVVAFFGVLLLGIPLLLSGASQVNWPSSVFACGMVVLVGIVLLCINVVVQFGLARVSANRAIVIMLFEVGFAALSSYLLTDESLQLREWAGGAMILVASLFSARIENKA